MTEFTTFIGTDGREHTIPTTDADRFFHGSDGSPLTDEQYDEMRRRESLPPEAFLYLVPEEIRQEAGL